MADLNVRNECLTSKLLQQGYLRLESFFNILSRHFEFVSLFNVGLRRAYQNENNFTVTIVYVLKNIGRTDSLKQFRKVIICFERIGYNNSLHA